MPTVIPKLPSQSAQASTSSSLAPLGPATGIGQYSMSSNSQGPLQSDLEMLQNKINQLTDVGQTQKSETDRLQASVAEANKRYAELLEEKKKLEQIKDSKQVDQWREKVQSMETSVDKYNGELRSLDDQRAQMNHTIAQVSALSLECGKHEKDCIRNKRENSEWQERMKKSTGMERLMKTLQDQIEDWKEKCLALEASCFKYQQEQNSAAQLEVMLANGQNQLRNAEDAQRNMQSEIALLQAENDRLRMLTQTTDPNQNHRSASPSTYNRRGSGAASPYNLNP